MLEPLLDAEMREGHDCSRATEIGEKMQLAARHLRR